MLNQFQSLAQDYVFGGAKAPSNGVDLDRSISMNLNRPSLLYAFRNNRPIPFGPASDQTFVTGYSEDEESEVDITEYPWMLTKRGE